MKNYERLTNRNCYYDFIPFSTQHVRRLQELENMLEDGLLEQLPCAEGTTVYLLAFEKDDPCAWCKHDHSGFGDTICDLEYDEYPTVYEYLNGKPICPNFKVTVWEIKFSLSFWAREKEEFNITWFLNKETALAKCEEIKKEMAANA